MIGQANILFIGLTNDTSIANWCSPSFFVKDTAQLTKITIFKSSSVFLLSKDLKHNIFKNVSNWVIFLWQTQFPTNEYGLNDEKRMKKELSYIDTLRDSSTPSDINFQTILLPKVILAKFLSQKIYSLGPFLS